MSPLRYAGMLIFSVALSGAVHAAPTPGGSLTMALRGDPGTLDCHAVSSSTVAMAIFPAYSTLLRFDPASDYQEVAGDVAASWTVSPDGLVYTFKLAPNVKFHDGSALTSADVKATYDRMRQPPEGVASVRRALFADIESIETPDDMTVVFRLKTPNPAMLTVFANPWNCLYSAERLAKDPTFPTKEVMGSGPFRLVEYTPGTRILYEKFPDYFRTGMPYLDRLESIIVSHAGVVPALASGQIEADFFTFSRPLQQQIANSRGDKTVFDTASMATMSFVAFNTKRAALADARVRQALTLAIDRQSGDQNLPKLISIQGFSPIYRAETPYALSREQQAALPGYGSDIEQSRNRAKALLAEANAGDLKLTLLSPSSRDPFETLAVYLADAWRRIGVETEIRALDSAAYLAAKSGGDYDAVIDWNSPIGIHPIEVLEKYVPGSAGNTAYADDARLVELYEKIKLETDASRLAAAAQQFQQHALEQAYVAPLFWATRTTAVPNDLRGWKTPPSFYFSLDHAGLWRDTASGQ